MPRPRPSAVALLLALFPFSLIVFGLNACSERDVVAEARALQETGDFEGAIEVLREYLVDENGDAEAQFLYGSILSRIGEPSRAQWPLLEAMRDSEWETPAGIVLARNAIATGNHHSATQVTEGILAREPENLEAIELHAHAAIASRKAYAVALEDAERLRSLDPDHPDAGVLRAIALLGLERVEEAEDEIYATAEAREDVSRDLKGIYCVGMVEFQVEIDNLEAAESQLDRCLADFPMNFRVISAALAFYDSQDQRDRGLDLLRTTLEAAPHASDLRYQLASRLHNGGDSDSAEALLREATTAKDVRAATQARLDLAKFYRGIGRFEESARELEQVVEVLGAATTPQIQFSMGDAWIMAGHYDKALAAAGEMSDPAHRALIEGQVAIFRDQYVLALEKFDEGYKTWPDNATARYYGGYAAEQLGLFDRAIEEYRYSIRADASATDARYRLARLFAREGNPVVAAESIMMDIENTPLSPEGLRLAVELGARLDRMDLVRRQLSIVRGIPGEQGPALAAAARGLGHANGPKFAGDFIASAEIDLSDPRDVEALRTLVMMYANAGELKQAHDALQDVIDKRPGFATFYEIRGLLFERYGKDPASAGTAYKRALSLDPADARSLAGIARLEVGAKNAQAAVAYFARAHQADASDPAIGGAYAAALLDFAGDEERARSVLETVLREDPQHGRAAHMLGVLEFELDATSDRTLDLARRAARFAGTRDAFELLAKSLDARGETDAAEQVRSRAEERRTSGPSRASR